MSNATIRYKQYNTYKDYMNHQASKLDKAIHRNNAMKLAKREKQSTIKFIQEFEPIVSLLERLPVLCLGARRGMEVSAFMKLGFDKSIGIDLNQKKSIQGTVIPGDFHYIPFRSNSFHNIYMNCLDHCLSIDDVLLEINRVLVVDGKFITRIVRDSGAYGSCRWNKNEGGHRKYPS